MKLIRVLSLSLLVVMHGMPLPALAQNVPATFNLPECRAGEVCRVNIVSVLREKYGLRLETDARAPAFRWALADGELPPGLVLRANGTIVGTPRRARTELYPFEVKVIQANAPGVEALKFGLTMSISTPQIRLVQVSVPRLVPVDTAAENSGDAPKRASTVAPRFTGGSFFADPDPPEAMKVSTPTGATWGASNKNTFARTTVDESTAALNNVSTVNLARPLLQALPAPPCDTSTVPTPSPAAGAGVYYLDARNGNLTENGQLVSPRKRFKKGHRVTVVVDNKNPYLYTYSYVPTASPVQDAALGKFVPFIVGNLGDLNASPAAPAAPNAAPAVAPAPPGAPGKKAQPTPTPNPCLDARTKTDTLINDVRNAVTENGNLRNALDAQKVASPRLLNAYNAARLPLFAQNQTRENLYRASVALVNAVDANMAAVGGVNTDTLDQLERRISAQTRAANRFKSRIEVLREAHPNCLDQIGEDLRKAGEVADDLLDNAQNYQQVLNQIKQSLNTAIEARNLVLTILCNPNAFYEVHVEGGFEETNEVEIKLTVTPRQGVTEAQAVPGSPFISKFTFGGAPFFSISGGLIFSPLRKREYVRVQGFERNQAGELVLEDDKPKLATVIGLKESSPTRITPAIFLNGRLKSWDNRVIDGVHLTLGITAKNDNEGTDVEFLIGPSLSLLERKMFFTVGGYAGRQQRLAGNLFEGFALPAEVDEIPIEKNYRWNVGFSLSYRIPVTQ